MITLKDADSFRFKDDVILVDGETTWWSDETCYTGSTTHWGIDNIKRSKLERGKKYNFNKEDEILTEDKTGWLCIKDYTGPNYKTPTCPECNSENIKDSRCLDCGEWL